MRLKRLPALLATVTATLTVAGSLVSARTPGKRPIDLDKNSRTDPLWLLSLAVGNETPLTTNRGEPSGRWVDQWTHTNKYAAAALAKP